MKKVYCRNCKFCKRLTLEDNFLFSFADCLIDEHEPSRKEKFKIKTDVIKSKCKYKKINWNQDCILYKRTWWKFWIKDKENKMRQRLHEGRGLGWVQALVGLCGWDEYSHPRCEVCGLVYGSEGHLRNHVEKVHEEEVERLSHA